MSFVNRTYPDIVQDMLTVLTGGIASEAHSIVYDPPPVPVVLPRVLLTRRPVARVSFVKGFIAGRTADDPPVPYVFGLNDYELISSTGDPNALDTLRFLPFGRRPAGDTTLLINYYPRSAQKTPITDVNVGSVARTMLETVAKELGSLYAQLDIAYDSGFVETAKGAALDRVVALLGYSRFRAGRPVGVVTFSRRPGSTGEITIPAGTPVTDTQDKIRYETVDTHLMHSEESIAQVRVRGATEATAVVPPKTLTVIARAVAGLSAVTNEQATTRASDDESDDDLRLRVRGALTAADKGTIPALRFGLLQMDEVRDVTITEMPNGVPGEIAITLSLANGATEIPEKVKARIEQLRPAGINVLPPQKANAAQFAAKVKFLLAGSTLPSNEIIRLQNAARDTLVKAIRAKDIGQPVRIKPLVAALLNDSRVVDVTLTIGEKGQPPATGDVSVPAGTVVELDPQDVTFEPPAFEAAPTAPAATVFDVAATLSVSTIAGITVNDARVAIRRKLETLFGSVKAGDTIDAQRLLDAMRDDGKYVVDAAAMLVAIGGNGTAVPVRQGGPVFHVAANQAFNVAAVEVTG